MPSAYIVQDALEIVLDPHDDLPSSERNSPPSFFPLAVCRFLRPSVGLWKRFGNISVKQEAYPTYKILPMVSRSTYPKS